MGWLIAAALLAPALFAYLIRTLSNYRHNKKASPEGLIVNQTGDVGKLRYALFRTSYNGCGWIAVYNALCLLGRNEKAEDIIRELEWTGVFLFGVFGTRPLAIVRFLRRRGLSVRIVRDPEKYDAAAAESDASIAWFFHKKGAHFVTLRREGDRFVGYNTYSNSKAAESWGPSVSARLKAGRYRPVMLITVNKKNR